MKKLPKMTEFSGQRVQHWGQNGASIARHAWSTQPHPHAAATFRHADAPLRDDPRFVIVDIGGAPPPGRSALERGRHAPTLGWWDGRRSDC